MPTFREPCSPLHQGKGQPDTELFLQAVPFYITLLVGVVGMGGEGEEVVGGERDGGIGRSSITGRIGLPKEQPGGTAQYQAAPRPDEVDCKIHETLASQEWIWTRRKSAKRITFIQKAPVKASRICLNSFIMNFVCIFYS
ncbi:hypothetical protein ALC57_16824 [Trachymyrmex cornetzi]|uniref:Uncharacterized protein n=1 Tax=Trachymyrmex cornetzi TaxID=471704 RepID=A0A151IUU1_9HYME|nr:hypothetical protein ALC57_16824 [Trachymyrmex cornetzi]